MQGTVLLEYTVGKTGRANNIKIIEELPFDKGFGSAAIKALEGWFFEPATYGDSPINSEVQQRRFTFKR